MSIFFGDNLRLEISGASHAPEIGMKLEGLPAGCSFDPAELKAFLARRAPGRTPWSTSRREPDWPVFRSGVKTEGDKMILTGEPLSAAIANTDVRPADYDAVKTVPRPGHADFSAMVKYGLSEAPSGGGPFSGRMTAALCLAGGICLSLLKEEGIQVISRIAEIHGIPDEGELRASTADKVFPTVSREAGEKMIEEILRARDAGDSVGGIIECAVLGLPAGLGGPLFEGMEGRISQLLFAIPAVKGVEFGVGFEAAAMLGSEHNDAFCLSEGGVRTCANHAGGVLGGITTNTNHAGGILGGITTNTNHAGGILGGITNGMPLTFRLVIKPTPSIAIPQQSVDLKTGKETLLSVKGRHDPCIVPRAVPCAEAAAAIAICDALLTRRRELDGAADKS